MSRRSKFFVHVFAWSVALFLLHLALARAIDIPVGGYIYFTLLTVLEKLERAGFPQLTTGSDSGWPVPTHLGSVLFVFVWWLFYFIIALVVGAVIRRIRIHATQTV
jgi:hypothetical protein